MEGEADFGDFAAVPGLGSAEDLVTEAEVAVLFAPVDPVGQCVEHSELVFFGFTKDDDLSRLL